jgi:hypothetical protein
MSFAERRPCETRSMGAVSRSRLQRRRCGQTATPCAGEHSRRLAYKVSVALVVKGLIQSRTDKFTWIQSNKS